MKKLVLKKFDKENWKNNKEKRRAKIKKVLKLGMYVLVLLDTGVIIIYGVKHNQRIDIPANEDKNVIDTPVQTEAEPIELNTEDLMENQWNEL